MKKRYLLFAFACLLTARAGAVVHTVGATAANTFTPEVLTVQVGDTVRWVRQGGSHTTTSTSVPAGAAPWDALLNTTTTSFSYVVTVPGTYQYVCSFHPGMDGSFTATGTSGTVEATPQIWLTSNIVQNRLNVAYQLGAPAKVQLALFDQSGRAVRTFDAADRDPGTFSKVYFVGALPRGLYVLVLYAGGQRVARQLVLN